MWLWVVLFVAVFALFWSGIAFILSRISGWATVANAYPAGDVLTPSVRYNWQSAWMNGTTKYGAALTVAADSQAVHWSIFPLLSVGHRPFSIPWQDIGAEMRQLAFVQRVSLRFARVPGVTMLITPRLAARLAAASQGRLMVPDADVRSAR